MMSIFVASWRRRHVHLAIQVEAISQQQSSLNECLRDFNVISEHISELCHGSKAENRTESAGGRHRAESVVIFADTVFAFPSHGLPLHIIKAPPPPLLMETALEGTI